MRVMASRGRAACSAGTPSRAYDRNTGHVRPANLQVGLMGSRGVAAISIATLDPPRRVASPAVPALVGSGSPLRSLPEQCGKSFPEKGKFFPVLLKLTLNALTGR